MRKNTWRSASLSSYTIFPGKEDVLGKAVAKAAEANNINLKVISVDKGNGTGAPQRSLTRHTTRWQSRARSMLTMLTTYSRLRWREQQGMPGPVRSRGFPYGFESNSVRSQEECDKGTVMLAIDVSTWWKRLRTAKVAALWEVSRPLKTRHQVNIQNTNQRGRWEKRWPICRGGNRFKLGSTHAAINKMFN